MINLIVSFLVAGLGIFLVFIGFFFLLSPRDMLTVRYQNWRLRATGRPLKDEDFPRMDSFITRLKLLGFLLLLVGVVVLVFAFTR